MTGRRRPAVAGSAAVLVAAIALPLTAAPAWSGDDADRRAATYRARTVADAHPDRRGERVWSLGWAVRRTTAADVRVTNLAVATTRCDRCRAVAVSVQVVLVGRTATARRPLHLVAANTAVAVTARCRHCSALALAYQFVVIGPGRLVLTPAARREITGLEQRMHALVRSSRPGSGPDDATLAAEADVLASALADVLRAGVVAAPTTPPTTPPTTGPATGPATAPAATVPAAAAPAAAVGPSTPQVQVHRAVDRAGPPSAATTG